MENKKLGFVILSISAVATILMMGFMSGLNMQTNAMRCYPTNECQRVESLLGMSHVAVGLISFVAALGTYLLFFSTGEEAILKRLEDEKSMRLNENKFELILKSMDENEKKVIKAIREQEGITQATLRYRADMSKAKLSQILTDFERKSLVKRIEKGKTYEVYLAQNF